MSAAAPAEKLTTLATEAIRNASQDYYVFIIVFLLASALIVPLAQRFKVSGVLGFLLVGVLMGPDALGRLSHYLPGLDAFSMIRTHAVHRLAELGVVFLLFSIGLELTFERLKAMRRLVLGLGASQIVLSSVALAAVFFVMGRSLVGSTLLGMALALSSTAVIIPVLADRKALNSASGRSVFAVLLAQDVAVAPIMVTVMILTTAPGGQGVGAQGLLALIPALIGMGVLILAGRWLLRPLFNTVALSGSRELFMAASLLVILVAGQVATMTGMSMALGAFVAGVLLAETEYRREIEVMIEPFKGLLLGLFFVTVGARLDFDTVMAQPVLVLGLAAGLIALKFALIFPLARGFGLSTPRAIETAAVLGPAGEFAYVIIDEAINRHVVPAAFGHAVILSATLSLFSVPLLAMLSARAAARFDRQRDAPPTEAPEVVGDADPVIIVGFGRVGELVADMLKAHDIAFTVVDFNPQVTKRARARGLEAWYGNASVPDFLTRLGLQRARAVVVTVSNAGFTENVVRTVRGMRDDVHIIARARDAQHAQTLYKLGATDAVPETIEASLQLAENTLIDLGVPMGLVLASVHEQRDVFRRQFGSRDGQHEAGALRGRRLAKGA
ncbi:MAG: cation:proton antiporter domain-containing protein [Asticcacaulis sp.]|uniref:cation:proton antiporter domain-containing protein n=1 Tax=Asticcacaulis sp. TaxID=1872648 RepID=UPI003F7B4720